jgi:hypothetical protein
MLERAYICGLRPKTVPFCSTYYSEVALALERIFPYRNSSWEILAPQWLYAREHWSLVTSAFQLPRVVGMIGWEAMPSWSIMWLGADCVAETTVTQHPNGTRPWVILHCYEKYRPPFGLCNSSSSLSSLCRIHTLSIKINRNNCVHYNLQSSVEPTCKYSAVP